MISLSGIDNIIFDLGGVILNIDYNLSAEAFKRLGAENFDELYSQARQSDLFDRLETGMISPMAFRDEVRQIFSSNWTDDEIDEAWNAMLLDLPSARINFLQELSKKYRIFLLSNTNEIHYLAYSKMVNDQYGLGDLGSLFQKAYFSHQINKRKPYPETFEFVLEDAGIKADNSLFIDDSIQHLEGAKKVGLSVYHHTEGDITEQFSFTIS